MSYGCKKKCKSCGRITYHHHELDEICMDCEAAECYPDDEFSLAMAQSFKILAMAGDYGRKDIEEKQIGFIGRLLKKIK